MLARRLEGAGHRVLAVREPGGTAVGEALRNVLLNHPGQPLDVRAETLIFAAARAQLVAEVLKPALDQGRILLCDRFADSTLALSGVWPLPGSVVAQAHDRIRHRRSGTVPAHIPWTFPRRTGWPDAWRRSARMRNSVWRMPARANGTAWMPLDLAFHQRV